MVHQVFPIGLASTCALSVAYRLRSDFLCGCVSAPVASAAVVMKLVKLASRRNNLTNKLDLKLAIRDALTAAKSAPRPATLTAQIDDAFEGIEEALRAGVTIRTIAERTGVDPAVFAQTLRAVRYQRCGLTRAGTSRKRGGRLKVSPGAAALAAASTQAPGLVASPGPAPMSSAALARPVPPVPRLAPAAPGGKVFLSPAARECLASRSSATGLDAETIEQARQEKAAIAQGRRHDIEPGGFKK